MNYRLRKSRFKRERESTFIELDDEFLAGLRRRGLLPGEIGGHTDGVPAASEGGSSGGSSGLGIAVEEHWVYGVVFVIVVVDGAGVGMLEGVLPDDGEGRAVGLGLLHGGERSAAGAGFRGRALVVRHQSIKIASYERFADGGEAGGVELNREREREEGLGQAGIESGRAETRVEEKRQW